MTFEINCHREYLILVENTIIIFDIIIKDMLNKIVLILTFFFLELNNCI